MFDFLMKKGLPVLADIAIDKGEAYVKDLVKDKFGYDLDAGTDIPEEHLTSLQNFDADLEAEKEANHHQESMFKMQTADTQDARTMYKENVAKGNKAGEYFMYAITVLVVLGGGSALIFMALDESVREFIKPLVTAAVFFWLGSSHGSKQKDEQAHKEKMAGIDNELF